MNSIVFERTSFGNIIISGKRYNHDIYLHPNGEIIKRDKSQSKRIRGHRELAKIELKHLIEEEPDVLIIGTGQYGSLPIDKETKGWLETIKNENTLKIIKDRTPMILDKVNELIRSSRKVAGIFHITC